MATVATLTIDLLGNSAKLTSELRKSTISARNWAKDTRKVVNTVGKSFAATSALGAASLTAIYADAAATADQLAKMSDRIAEAPERLTGLQYAAELTGAGTDTLNSSLERMVKGLGEAKNGTGSAKKTLEELGLATEEFFKLSPADQFSAIAEKVSGLSDQQQKAAAAAALFGKSGVALVNTLDLGASGLAAMTAEADALDLTMSRIDLAKIEAANDSFYRAKQVSEGFGRSLAVAVAPLLDAVSQKFVQSAKEAGGFGNVAQKVVDATARGVGVMADGLHGVKILYRSVILVVNELFNAQMQAYAYLDRAITGLLNKLPGVEAQHSELLQGIAESSKVATEDMRANYEALLLEPIPSEKIKTFIDDAYKKSEAAAAEVAQRSSIRIPVAATVEQISSIGASGSNKEESKSDAARRKRLEAENTQLLEVHQSHMEQLHEARLQAEGKVIDLEEARFARQQEKLQQELDQLKERGLLTSEIEAEHRQAQLDAEEVHQLRLNEITQKNEAERRAVLEAGYGYIFDAASAHFDGMQGKEAAYARSAISLAKTLSTEKGREALKEVWQNTYAAATGAYRALSVIPIVGPVLGAAAFTAVAATGAMAAGKLTGMAHDGLDKVPETGTWLLQKGEKVTTEQTSKKLDSTLDEVRSGLRDGRPNQRSTVFSPTQNIYFTGKQDNYTAAQLSRETERKQRIAARRLSA